MNNRPNRNLRVENLEDRQLTAGFSFQIPSFSAPLQTDYALVSEAEPAAQSKPGRSSTSADAFSRIDAVFASWRNYFQQASEDQGNSSGTAFNTSLGTSFDLISLNHNETLLCVRK